MVKSLPAMQKTRVQSLGQEDALEKGMATHSSILAWRIPIVYSPWGHKESGMTEQLNLTELKAALCVFFLAFMANLNPREP